MTSRYLDVQITVTPGGEVFQRRFTRFVSELTDLAPPLHEIVDHLHVHIIPRWSDDGHGQWHGNPYQDGEIGTIRDIIGQEFK